MQHTRPLRLPAPLNWAQAVGFAPAQCVGVLAPHSARVPLEFLICLQVTFHPDALACPEAQGSCSSGNLPSSPTSGCRPRKGHCPASGKKGRKETPERLVMVISQEDVVCSDFCDRHALESEDSKKRSRSPGGKSPKIVL
ncbi:PREDICTED: uncharacterized protein LOC105592406 isoform X2 [Cercocebus atys]|uniref:uncharacterized protein LOC105592406 isoform X2 n=1 Tax=Cercocebus atys TaxID=9531 RepID=UPI0005F4F9F0|nr:PREDICTED: uncharacterized protein LOC105592406 isoform X2 [Cercocebus atys]